MADAHDMAGHHERLSLAVARLMNSRSAWRSALARPEGESPGHQGLAIGLRPYLALGRRWLRALGTESPWKELQEQLQPWIRQRPGAAMAIAALLGAGLMCARPWAQPGIWRTLLQLPWETWITQATTAEPRPP